MLIKETIPGIKDMIAEIQMSMATLAEVLQPALKDGYAVAGLVTLGWEDMCAYVAAAEAENVPIILQAGPSCMGNNIPLYLFWVKCFDT